MLNPKRDVGKLWEGVGGVGAGGRGWEGSLTDP